MKRRKKLKAKLVNGSRMGFLLSSCEEKYRDDIELKKERSKVCIMNEAE